MSKERITETVLIYVMSGAPGSADHAGVVCEDAYIVLDVYNEDGDYFEYEGKAHYLKDFCKEHGLGYQMIRHDYRFTIDTKVPE